MIIKSLIENTTDNPTLVSEHGLSLYIETKVYKVLFDVGQSDAFLDNAKMLGVDIEAVDALIISHGHYDHGGGLKKFLEVNHKAKVYLSEEAFGQYYSERPDGTMKYIGLDQSLKVNDRFVFVRKNMKVCECLTVFKNESNKAPAPTMNRYLYKKVNGEMVRDDFTHEINLIVSCDGKSVLIAGCAHNGIVNIVDTYEKHTGAEPNMVIGGYHLSSDSRGEMASEGTINGLIRQFASTETEFYTCHCTGVKVYEMMKVQLGDQISYLSCGKSIHL